MKKTPKFLSALQILIFACFAPAFCEILAKNPLSTIENPLTPAFYVTPKDMIRARERTGLVAGIGIGLPGSSVQRIRDEEFTEILSYGYRILIGYQDYLRVLSFLPRGIFGARLSLQSDDTFRVKTGHNTIASSSYHLNYDVLLDLAYFPNENTIGFLMGFYIGATKISGFQDYSYDNGLRFGVGFGFGFDHRLDIMYKFGKSGELRGERLYPYSAHTIDIIYTTRSDFFKSEPIVSTPVFDNTNFLRRDK